MTTNRYRGQARVNSPGRGAPSVQARRATRRPRRDARQFRVLIWLSVGNGIVGGARRPSPDVSVDVGREFDDANQRVWKILDVQRRQGSPPLFLYAGLYVLSPNAGPAAFLVLPPAPAGTGIIPAGLHTAPWCPLGRRLLGQRAPTRRAPDRDSAATEGAQAGVGDAVLILASRRNSYDVGE